MEETNMFNKLKQKWREDIYMLDIEKPNKAVEEKWGFIKLFFEARLVRKLFKSDKKIIQ